ncbi:MAG: hypothetical protein AVDCRST_MAG77-4932 [uncultured Chloroflexi bacterium]|uniref:Uncharacterized protein n=1 Tax=uncultured Chloroflexota bacterium TaxID=166587 RepID=A0A6J4K1L0_9CHLR|nr:MAG: hypothetical protein AVDCRST_MAG77-4932 [uncultured Chloroflexota bacterium]
MSVSTGGPDVEVEKLLRWWMRWRAWAWIGAQDMGLAVRWGL